MNVKSKCLLLILFFPVFASAQNLRTFLNSCAWGVVGGATAGVVSLAVVDKPSESWSNVAKGASLGLYAGIAYGIYQINKEPEVKTFVEPSFTLGPQFDKNGISGVQLHSVVYRF